MLLEPQHRWERSARGAEKERHEYMTQRQYCRMRPWPLAFTSVKNRKNLSVLNPYNRKASRHSLEDEPMPWGSGQRCSTSLQRYMDPTNGPRVPPEACFFPGCSPRAMYCLTPHRSRGRFQHAWNDPNGLGFRV